MSRSTIDTRDLYKRQQELQDLKDALESARGELKEADIPENARYSEWPKSQWPLIEAEEDALKAFGTDEQEELDELDNLESEISEWMHGTEMIPEDEFEDYARELADDLGSTKGNEWPFTCIDWERAARELAMDYTTVSYQGEDYYVRA